MAVRFGVSLRDSASLERGDPEGEVITITRVQCREMEPDIEAHAHRTTTIPYSSRLNIHSMNVRTFAPSKADIMAHEQRNAPTQWPANLCTKPTPPPPLPPQSTLARTPAALFWCEIPEL